MKADAPDNPRSLGATISVSYVLLLGQYCRDRKESEKESQRKNRNDIWQLINSWRKGREVASGPNGPKDKVGYWAQNLDLFGNEIVDSGGVGVLESLFMLDVGTLAALIEWNRINLLLVDQKLMIRRTGVFLAAGLGFVGTLYKMDLFKDPIIMQILGIFGRGLFRHLWLGLFAASIGVFSEVLFWQPGKTRVEEFGQLLGVAFAYVSNMPNAVKERL